MKSNRIRLVVVLGAISIIFIVAFQVYWVYNTFDLKEKQFNQRVSIALFNVANRLAEFNGSQSPDLSPVMQVSSSYFIVDVNEPFDPLVLEHFLTSELSGSNINIDFEYAMYDCETDRMLYGKYISYADGKTGEPNEMKFSKADDLAYYFGVFFPTKPTYILQSMNLWIISSVIILTALGFFIYAIFIILRQKRLSEIQKDFINNMTHEFKTPISSIAISAGVLQEDDILDDPDRLKTYANIIASQNMKLEEHIERVLLSARTEKKGMEIQLEKLDVCDLLKEVVHSYRNRMPDSSQISIDCLDKQTYIQADRAHLTNLVYNLLDNAVKYSGADPVITVGCNTEAGKVMIFVEDNGQPIDKKYHRKIFDPLFRIPGNNVSSVKGFGLGLNYVKYIARAHGWKIRLESKQGKGNKFIVQI